MVSLCWIMAWQKMILHMQKSIFYSGRHKGLSIGNGIVFYLMHVVIIFAPAFAIIASSLSVI